MSTLYPRVLFGCTAMGLAASACLPAEKPVQGISIEPGRLVEHPAFVDIGEKPWVTYEVRTGQGGPGQPLTSDVWLAPWKGEGGDEEAGEKRVLVRNKSSQWSVDIDSDGIRYFMTDESQLDEAAPAGAVIPVGILNRVSLVDGVLDQIPGVSNFSLSGRRLFYRRPVVGSNQPELHIRDPDGTDRVVGHSAGAAQLTGEGRLYFLTGEDRTLSRYLGPDQPVQALRARVSRFLLRWDERFAVISLSKDGKASAIALDLVGLTEQPLPGQGNPCCWIGFLGPEFVYSETASDQGPAKLHFFDLATGKDREFVLPQGLEDVSSITGRPGRSVSLVMDGHGNAAYFDPGHDPPLWPLGFRPSNPSFTEDGRSIIYVEEDTTMAGNEGRLMVRDADFVGEPRVLSPYGSMVSLNGYFFIPDGNKRLLVFWARYGRSPSDLYFADHETGIIRKVAEGISQVTVTPRRIVGIIRVSQQDLVGDLVQKDVESGVETIIGHRVSDATVWGKWVAFIVREREPSRHDGLWAATLQ